jgi:hypothetical protein
MGIILADFQAVGKYPSIIKWFKNVSEVDESFAREIL